jgi:hypothetical protein
MHRDSETAFFDVSNPVLAASATWILPDLDMSLDCCAWIRPVEANAIAPAMLVNSPRRWRLMVFMVLKGDPIRRACYLVTLTRPFIPAS